ncbi:hypothetical protein OAO01_07020 [Oligoflexia bacterium]|nr:hypothetical protein [Oligoflexia bacterium]
MRFNVGKIEHASDGSVTWSTYFKKNKSRLKALKRRCKRAVRKRKGYPIDLDVGGVISFKFIDENGNAIGLYAKLLPGGVYTVDLNALGERFNVEAITAGPVFGVEFDLVSVSKAVDAEPPFLLAEDPITANLPTGINFKLVALPIAASGKNGESATILLTFSNSSNPQNPPAPPAPSPSPSSSPLPNPTISPNPSPSPNPTVSPNPTTAPEPTLPSLPTGLPRGDNLALVGCETGANAQGKHANVVIPVTRDDAVLIESGQKEIVLVDHSTNHSALAQLTPWKYSGDTNTLPGINLPSQYLATFQFAPQDLDYTELDTFLVDTGSSGTRQFIATTGQLNFISQAVLRITAQGARSGEAYEVVLPLVGADVIADGDELKVLRVGGRLAPSGSPGSPHVAGGPNFIAFIEIYSGSNRLKLRSAIVNSDIAGTGDFPTSQITLNVEGVTLHGIEAPQVQFKRRAGEYYPTHYRLGNSQGTNALNLLPELSQGSLHLFPSGRTHILGDKISIALSSSAALEDDYNEFCMVLNDGRVGPGGSNSFANMRDGFKVPDFFAETTPILSSTVLEDKVSHIYEDYLLNTNGLESCANHYAWYYGARSRSMTSGNGVNPIVVLESYLRNARANGLIEVVKGLTATTIGTFTRQRVDHLYQNGKPADIDFYVNTIGTGWKLYGGEERSVGSFKPNHQFQSTQAYSDLQNEIAGRINCDNLFYGSSRYYSVDLEHLIRFINQVEAGASIGHFMIRELAAAAGEIYAVGQVSPAPERQFGSWERVLYSHQIGETQNEVLSRLLEIAMGAIWSLQYKENLSENDLRPWRIFSEMLQFGTPSYGAFFSLYNHSNYPYTYTSIEREQIINATKQELALNGTFEIHKLRNYWQVPIAIMATTSTLDAIKHVSGLENETASLTDILQRYAFNMFEIGEENNMAGTLQWKYIAPHSVRDLNTGTIYEIPTSIREAHTSILRSFDYLSQTSHELVLRFPELRAHILTKIDCSWAEPFGNDESGTPNIFSQKRIPAVAAGQYMRAAGYGSPVPILCN